MSLQGVLVQMVPPGRTFIVADIPKAADVVAFMEARGFRFVGMTRVGGRLRHELQGQPMFQGLAGPMWGGEDAPLRYETWEAYEVMSR